MRDETPHPDAGGRVGDETPKQHIVMVRDDVDGVLSAEWFTGTRGASFFTLLAGDPETGETIFSLDEIELPQAVRALRGVLTGGKETAIIRNMGAFERLQFEGDAGYVTFSKTVLGEPDEMVVFSEREARTLLEALQNAIGGLDNVEDDPYV